MKSRKFIDRGTIYVFAGRGGDGSASFRREKFVAKGGPDGGDGGHGGDIILQASRDDDSLLALFHAPHQKAGIGDQGRGQQLTGRSGKPLTVKVPCGTEVWDQETGELLVDLVEHGQEELIAKGGKGGLGNVHWARATHQTPTEFTTGKPGEEKTLRLILKTVADVGLVGLPNAGKSSLLSKISHAHPTIAAYPFTTLHPVVGTVQFDDYTLMKVADIPGLIEGAHDGVGLGHAFLRHIERAKALIFVVDIAGVDGRDPAEDYASLKRELELYKPELLERPCFIVANKMDLPDTDEKCKEFEQKTGETPMRVSAETDEGLDALHQALYDLGLNH